MILKFKSINNLAVFNGFEWDSSVKSKNGVIQSLKQINVIYGRNYSGKTTLSRIVRAMETGILSNKYENPDFTVELKDNSNIMPLNLTSHSKIIRVFNDDFVRENLRFIFNPEEDIKSFAILGSDNNIIEREIEELQLELGIKEEGRETGLYKALKEIQLIVAQEKDKFVKAESALNEKLKFKALDRINGIKYKSERFGDQNYTTTKLESEIQNIINDNYQPPSNEKIKELDKLLMEKPNPPISDIYFPAFSFNSLSNKARTLVERKIAESDKIEELVKDSVLNRWANEGREYHRNKREKCAFCGNIISQGRWNELDKHFDKESEQLEKDINDLIQLIEKEKIEISVGFRPLENEFYTEFHSKIDDLKQEYLDISGKYINNLNTIVDQLLIRKDSLINPFTYADSEDFSDQLRNIFNKYEVLRKESDNYTNQLSSKQNQSKEILRLKEVYDFALTIDYTTEVDNIKKLKINADQKEMNKEQLFIKIAEKENLLDSKKRQLKDEEEGANKVNEYLNDFFGHRFLSLEAIECVNDNLENDKIIHFEIKRNGKKAHHLSEGECSLISFCYFIAKLEDITTKGQKPIIWIDDPVSSLDGNHIFFLYSLIKSEIIDNNSFEQIFISTHNLNFLKYLKRLNGGVVDLN